MPESITEQFEIAPDEMAAFLSLSSELFCTIDQRGYFQKLSSSWQDLGWTLAELIAQPWLTWVHPDDRALTLNAIALATTEPASPIEFEHRFCNPDGDYCWLSWRISSLRSGVVCGVGTRRRIDRMQLLEAVVVNAHDAVVITEFEPLKSPAPRIVYVNEAFTHNTGYRPEEVLGKSPHMLHGEKTDRSALAAIQRAAVERKLLTIELINYRKDGSAFWAELELMPLTVPLSNKHHSGHLVWVQRDISNRKRLERSLLDSEERFRTSVENLLDCFGIYAAIRDREGQMIGFRSEYLNPAAHQHSDETMKTLNLLSPSSIGADWFNACCGVVATGNPLEKEWLVYEEILGQSQLAKAYDIRLNKLGDGFAACWRNITQRKQGDEEIRRALDREKELNELKSGFITMVSHEFRNPLSTILCAAELLENYGQQWTEEKKQVRLVRIKQAVQRMSQMLNQVLVMGKAEAGKLKFQPTLIDAVQFCRDLIEELQPQLPHTLTFRSIHPALWVKLDAQLLRHILTNLIGNALKYSPQGGNVQLELACAPETVSFCIQDQGIGIPASEQAELFAMFQRGSNVGMISGTGLGLAIVKQCLDLHGGNITVASEVDKGTLFTVTLRMG